MWILPLKTFYFKCLALHVLCAVPTGCTVYENGHLWCVSLTSIYLKVNFPKSIACSIHVLGMCQPVTILLTCNLADGLALVSKFPEDILLFSEMFLSI